jgi:hypothetical protein
MFDVTTNAEIFERNLQYVIRSMPRESKLIMRRVGAKSRTIIKSTARRLVKEKTGRYMKSWKLGKAYMNDESNYRIRVFNNAPHAHLIEDGHRIVRGGREVGFAEGKKIIQKSNSKLEEKWEENLTKELNKIIENI